MMVEVMCGVLGGGPFGLSIRDWSDEESDGNADVVTIKKCMYFVITFSYRIVPFSDLVIRIF